MKILFRFLLLCCLLFSSGYGFAHTAGDVSTSNFARFTKQRKQRHHIRATEIEVADEEIIACAKCDPSPKSSFDFLARLSTRVFKKNAYSCFPFGKHFFYTSPHKYILHQVFRI